MPAFIPFLAAHVELARNADLVLTMVTRAREMQRKSPTLDPGDTFDIEVAARYFRRFRTDVSPLLQKFRDQAAVLKLLVSTEQPVPRREHRRRRKVSLRT